MLASAFRVLGVAKASIINLSQEQNLIESHMALILDTWDYGGWSYGFLGHHC